MSIQMNVKDARDELQLIKGVEVINSTANDN